MLKSELIYYLNAIDTYKTLTLAAENLFMTQPALSIAIKTFEKNLGIPLIHKTNNRATLTNEAKKILEITQPVLSCLNDAELYINNCTIKHENFSFSLLFSNNISIVVAPNIIEYINSNDTNLSVILKLTSSNEETIDKVLSAKDSIGILFAQNSIDFSFLPNYKKLLSDKLYLKTNKESKFFSSTTTSINSSSLSNIPLVLMCGPLSDDLLKRIHKPNILCNAPNLAIMDNYITNDLAVGFCNGFSRFAISKNMQEKFRFIEITDSEFLSIILFSSPDVNSEMCERMGNIIRLALNIV